MEWIGNSDINDKDLEKIQETLKIKLPDDYCALIKRLNGKALRSAYFIHDKIGKIAYSRNLNILPNKRGNAIAMFDVINNGGKRYFPFGSVGNGDYFCFDLEKGYVVLYEHEKMSFIKVCDTYSELIEGLQEDSIGET